MPGRPRTTVGNRAFITVSIIARAFLCLFTLYFIVSDHFQSFPMVFHHFPNFAGRPWSFLVVLGRPWSSLVRFKYFYETLSNSYSSYCGQFKSAICDQKYKKLKEIHSSKLLTEEQSSSLRTMPRPTEWFRVVVRCQISTFMGNSLKFV